MFCYKEQIPKKEILDGVVMQILGEGDKLNAFHWDIEDGASVTPHQHENEQFGYIIKGGFKITIGDKTADLKAGDSYFVPSNIPHGFVAIGDTEAIDIFTPIRRLPGYVASESK